MPLTQATFQDMVITGVVIVCLGIAAAIGLTRWSRSDYAWQHKRVGVPIVRRFVSSERATEVRRWQAASITFGFVVAVFGLLIALGV